MNGEQSKSLKMLVLAGVVVLVVVGCINQVTAEPYYCGDPNHPYPVGDLNGDCKVDFLDFAILASHWLECTAPGDPNCIVEDGVEYCIQTDKAVYSLGGTVEMLYRVSNLTGEDVILGEVACDPLAYYDFRVMQGDSRIWRYPYMPVVLGFEDFHLGPYEYREFQTTWNMMNNNGTRGRRDDDFPAVPGLYNVVGEVDLVFGGERVPVSVQIEIVP